MANSKRTHIDWARTIVWFDVLSQRTNLGASGLDSHYMRACSEFSNLRTIDRQLEPDNRFSLYKDGLASPRPDLLPGGLPGALHVMEELVPGSAYWYFHPLFNLLDGPIHSSQAYLKKRENPGLKLMEEAINTIRNEGNRAQMLGKSVKERRRLKALEAARCIALDPRQEINPFSTQRIHSEVLRLGDAMTKILFSSLNDRMYRRYRNIRSEIKELGDRTSLDRLAAGIGLVLEAENMCDHTRHIAAASYVKAQLGALYKERYLQRVQEMLATIISLRFISGGLEGYSSDFTTSGVPESWKDFNHHSGQIKDDLT